MNKTKKGFTLIELIVVLAILAVIMAIAVPTAFGSIDSARKAADRGSLDGFNSAIRMQAGFVAADPKGTSADGKKMDSLGAALTASGISKTTKPQSAIIVKWNPPSANACGYFSEDDDGTPLVPSGDKSLYNQLVAIAGNENVTIVAVPTPTPTP